MNSDGRTLWTLILVAALAVGAWTAVLIRPDVAAAIGRAAITQTAVLQEVPRTVADEADAPVPDEGELNLDAAASYAAGRGLVGLAVMDRQTGRYLDNGAGAHLAMGSASVIKVVLAEELLHRASIGEITLGSSERARMETMLMDSDDSAASSLYSQFGGVRLILAALSRHGLTESGPPANPQHWGNTMVTAHDVAVFYNNLLAGSIPVADRDFLFGLLRRMAPTAADGFDQEFGVAGLASHPGTAVKQGWMCCLDDVRNVHSTAVLGPADRYIVVILTQYSPLQSWEYGQSTATEAARLIVDGLSL